jgi:hypothetical protein
MPNRLLARYFQGRGVFGDLDFAALKEAQPEELFTAWLSATALETYWRHKLPRCPLPYLVAARAGIPAKAPMGAGGMAPPGARVRLDGTGSI